MDQRDVELLFRLQRDVEDLKRAASEARKKAEDVAAELDQWRNEQQTEERKRLRTALLAAGAVIMTLGGFVWAEIIWPVIKAGLAQ